MASVTGWCANSVVLGQVGGPQLKIARQAKVVLLM